MNSSFSESEDAALAWLKSLSDAVKHGPGIAPGKLFAERTDCGQLVLEGRVRDTPLPKLISRELRVKDAERVIAEDSA